MAPDQYESSLSQPEGATPASEGTLPHEERVSEDSLARTFWPLWVLPFAVVGLSLLVAFYVPGSLSDFYFDTVFPFGITTWMGTFFAYGWEVQRLWIQEIPRKWAPYAVGAALVFLLMVIGGPEAIVDDPWLAGMMIFPGVRMLLGYHKRHATTR